MASASTWSLERLAALAAEVKAEIMRDLNPGSLNANALDEGKPEEAGPEEEAILGNEEGEGKTARWEVCKIFLSILNLIKYYNS